MAEEKVIEPPRGILNGMEFTSSPAARNGPGTAREHQITACAYALFASELSSQCHHEQSAVAAAIKSAHAAHGGFQACADAAAVAYGERPETAAPRMRWARRVVVAAAATRIADSPHGGRTNLERGENYAQPTADWARSYQR